MSESTITVVGNVATEPRLIIADGGRPWTRFRVGQNARRQDPVTGEWRDGTSSFYTVTCSWRLAENVLASLHVGDPVVVIGTARVKDWEADGRSGTELTIAGRTIGPDLNRSVARIQPRRRRAAEGRADGADGPDDADGGTRTEEQRHPAGVDPETGEVLDAADLDATELDATELDDAEQPEDLRM